MRPGDGRSPSSSSVLQSPALTRESALAILESNHGFSGEDLERWIPVALRESFQPMAAVPVRACPDCGAPPSGVVGRYVRFSTLISLHECQCGLIWANARIDPETNAWWFEAHAYFDEDYYTKERAAVFEQLVAELWIHAPWGGRVLDVGGAGGQLAERLRGRRPDLSITVQDVSSIKVGQAMAKGFDGLIGDQWMHKGVEPFDVIILSDSIYYEPNLPTLWSAVDRLLRPGGFLVLRVPNRVPVVRLAGLRQRFSREPATSLRGHNPDHLVICTPRYLERKLAALGCTSRWLPSPFGEGGRHLDRAYRLAQAVHRWTGLRLTPSHVLIARRPDVRGH